jgi:ANTAR domain-containing protein
VTATEVGQPAIGEVVVRRTATGWHVDGVPDDDAGLVEAMVLADLLTADLAPPPRPRNPDDASDEAARLRITVSQLEHALAARVSIEQAIGVLAQRLHMSPRSAFERLRRAARTRGRRVHDLAREVVESVTDPAVPLPPELHGRP